MAQVFTVKSNANRKIRATVQEYPNSCKAEDFTVEPVEGGFVVRMTVRDEAGQAFARYHDFAFAVPGIEPAPDADGALIADLTAQAGAVADRLVADQIAADRPTEAPAEDDVLDLPETFRLGRASREAASPAAEPRAPKARKAKAAKAPKALKDAKDALVTFTGATLTWPAPKPTKAAAGPGKFAVIREAAERGELPPVPDFSADLHKRNRGRLAQLVTMAEAADVAGLEAFPIKPNCTSPKAMDRYRNLCVTALKVRAAKSTA